MREWPLKIIRYLAGFLLLSSLHCTFAALAADGNGKTFLYSLIYLPVIVLLSEGQKKVKYFWQFLIFAGVGIGLVYFASRTAFDRNLGLVLVTVAAVSYFYARAKKKSCWLEEPFYPFLALYIVMILLEMRYESNLLKNFAIYGAGLYYLLCMYKKNMDEMQKILATSASLDRFPMKRLFQSNYLMMSFQTVIVTLGMCFASSVGVDGALSKMVQMIRNGIARFLRGLESDNLAGGTGNVVEDAQMIAVETKELSRFMEILLAIGDFLGWVIVIGLTLYAIYRLLKIIYRLYMAFDMNSVENGDQIEQLNVMKAKEEKAFLKKQRNDTLLWDRTPNSKIRKIYKKRVLKEWKEAPNESMTPLEIETRIAMGEKDKYIFHTLYEKARYGRESCTKEDASIYKKYTT